MTWLEDIHIYTPGFPLVRDQVPYVSVECLVSGDVVRVRRYGYVGESTPAGDYLGLVLFRGEEPWMGRDDMVGYRLRLVLTGGMGGSYLDDSFLIEGSLVEFVAGDR